jgi:predicted RND superfamily exporter protein
MKIRRVHFADGITRHPGPTLLIVVIITLLFFMINGNPEMFGLKMNTEEDEDAFLPEGDIKDSLDDLRNNYGSNVAYLQVLVKGKNGNVLTKEALIDILEVERQISSNTEVQNVLYPQPPSIMSLPSMFIYNFLLFQGVPPANITYDLMIDTLNSIDQSVLNENLTLYAEPFSFFLSKDFADNIASGQVRAKATLILVLYDSKKFEEIDEDKNPILDADLEIVDIIEEAEFSDNGVEYMGVYEQQYVNHIIETDEGMGIVFMLVIIIIVIILLLTYRSALDTILSIGAIFLAIIWMNAIAIILGLTFGTMSQAVPIILIGLGIDYALHMTMRYKEGRKKEHRAVRGAMLLALVTVGASLFLSALTTGLSFASNLVSAMKPMREFGLFLLIGILCTFIIVITLIPSVKLLVDLHKVKKQHKKEHKEGSYKEDLEEDLEESSSNPGPDQTEPEENPKNNPEKRSAFERGFAKLAHATSRKPIPILIVVLLFSAFCAYNAMQLQTEFDFKEFLPAEHQITDDISYIFDNFDFGADEAAVLIKGDVTTPEVLSAMDQTQTRILDDKHLSGEAPITSILTLMQDVASDSEGELYSPEFEILYDASDTNDDDIPDQNVEVLYTFLMANYTTATQNVLYLNEDTGDFEGTLIRISVNAQGGDFNSEIYDEMQDNIEPLEGVSGVDTFVNGGPIMGHVVITSIQEGGLQSLLITIIIAAIILTILFGYEYRSISMGLFAEVPVILVIMWVYGLMYLGGIPLTVMTIMISTLTVGIGIDYSIHITNRFMESIHDHVDVDKALESTVVNTGGALFGAAITTIGGFGILYLAPTNPMKMFGTFTALSISFSLIASIVVLPTLLGIYGRRKLAKDPTYFDKHVDIKEVRKHVHDKVHDYEHKLKDFEKHLIEAEHSFVHKIHEGEHKIAKKVRRKTDNEELEQEVKEKLEYDKGIHDLDEEEKGE